MKKYLSSFAVWLPVLSLLSAAAMVLVPALFFFFRLKQAAQGSGSVSLVFGDFRITISSEHFLSFALQRATWSAQRAIIVLDASGKFVEVMVSLVISRTANWLPASIPSSTWRSLVYPIYALPAWWYVGRGVDALLGHRRVLLGNMVLSITFAVISGVLCCGFRFGMSAAERQGQDLLAWFIEGLALWAVLFTIPSLAWLRQKVTGSPSASQS